VLGRVASLHYTHGLTHQKIADLLGLSRVQVTRLLAKAVREGIVEIRVHSDESIFPDLQIALAEKFGLKQVWVSPGFDDEEKNMESLGAVAAQCLISLLKPKDVVAVGLSVTLEHMIPHLPKIQSGAVFVPALGSRPGGAVSVNPHEIASELADKLGGFTRHLPAPFVMASKESADMMRREPDVSATLELARQASMGLYGLGGTQQGSGPLIEAIAPSGELEKLTKKGAVGDISGIYFDSEGKYVPSSIEKRIIGLSLEEILAIPSRLIVAGGEKKLDAIAAASKSGIVTDLVTDQRTAESLLDRP
jgi:DNA-binding transcriptional regulator LsrR (DeoR family)